MKVLNNVMFVSLLAAAVACAKKDDEVIPPPPPASGLEVLQGDINSNITLDASKKYLIRGKVYVNSGAVMTVPAGTTLFGEKSSDGTLVVNRGGKLVAKGTANNPIVFTSQGAPGFRNRGDWGGIVLLGRGYTNGNASSTIEGLTSSAGSENGLYGPGTVGLDEANSAAELEYVRIEFAGIDLSLDNELNSLTMGGCGTGTIADHIMISYANDDAYEWFGGSNNHKYIIAFSTLDDDFDSDRGFNGKVQYGLIVREASQADISGSRAFETSSNNAAPATHFGVTRHSIPTFANITVMGPLLFRPANQIDGFYRSVVEINSSSNTIIRNSVLTGFPTGVTYNGSGANALITDNVIAANTSASSTGGGSTLPVDFSTVNTIVSGNASAIFGADTVAGGRYAFNNFKTRVLQASTSPYLTGAPALNSVDAYFEDQTFYGAFGSSAIAGWDWNGAWVEFDALNKAY